MAKAHRPKYPDIQVPLIGDSDNFFHVVGKVRAALVRGGVPASEINEFVKEATSSDRKKTFETCVKWVTVT